MKTLRYLLASFIFAVGVAGPMMVVASPAPVSAVPACDGRLIGIPPWYRGLTKEVPSQSGTGSNTNECTIVSPAEAGGLGAFITKLALNIIEIGVVIAGYVAIGFILYGGFIFLTNGFNPSMVEKGRMTILNAVIGLAIALGAVGILNLIFNLLG